MRHFVLPRIQHNHTKENNSDRCLFNLVTASWCSEPIYTVSRTRITRAKHLILFRALYVTSHDVMPQRIDTFLPIASLLVGVALLMMGHGLMGTLLPLRGLLEGYTSAELGILGAVYFLGFGIGTVVGPRTISRVGHIRTFSAMAAVISISVILQSMSTDPVFWWTTRALTGFCLATLLIVIESWLNVNSTNENRGMIFSVYTVINLGVITAGQLLTTVTDIAGFTLFAIAAMLLTASSVPTSMTRTSAPAPVGHVKLRLGRLYNMSPVAVIGSLAIGLANGAFWALGPVFAQQETNDITMVAAFMSATVIAGALGQLPLGWVSDRCDRRKVIIMASIGAAMAAIGHYVAALHMPVAIIPCAFVFGLFALPLYALCAAHLNDQVIDDGYVEASSGLLLLYAAGAVAGPLIASLVMGQFGSSALFLFTGAIHILLTMFALFRVAFKDLPKEHEKMEFSDALVATGTVANLDPSIDK